MEQSSTNRFKNYECCLITAVYIICIGLVLSLVPTKSYALSEVQSESVFTLDSSLYNQKTFKGHNYQLSNISVSNNLNWLRDKRVYKHNFELLLQNGSQLNAYDFKLSEIYYEIKHKKSSLIIGRKKQNLSQVDEEWKLGLSAPLFNHDFMSPEKQGQVGFHYSTRNKNNYYLKTFVSYVHLPHQGPKYILENEKFSSLNPWFTLPPKQIQESSGVTDIKYSVLEPKVADVIFQPSINFQVGHEGESTWWSFAYANQVNPEIHKAYRFSQETNPDHFFVQVEAFTRRHQLFMADIGHRNNDTEYWLSYLKDAPASKYLKDRKWQETQIDEHDWISGGIKVNHLWTPNLSVNIDYIKRIRNKDKKDTVLGFDELEVILGRSYFERSESARAQIKYDYKINGKKKISFSTRFEYSIANQGQLATAKLDYRTNKINIFAESAVLSAEDSEKISFFSKFKGNDFIKLGGSYAF